MKSLFLPLLGIVLLTVSFKINSKAASGSA
jgi:hypothetical protein